MRLAIVTGTSRGLGEATAQLLLESNIHVFGISRSPNKHLETVADEHKIPYTHYSCDLSHIQAVEKTCKAISERLNETDIETLYLINNAAALEPIDKSININREDLVHHIHVNTVAPMLMTNYFLKQATEQNFHLYAVTVTSGAATRPVYGWSAYCSTKASINMYTKTVALEQSELKTGHKVFAFSPGIMDTAMQETIRSSSREAFIEVDTFKQYKEDHQLKNPRHIGSILVDILTDETNIENGKIYNAFHYI